MKTLNDCSSANTYSFISLFIGICFSTIIVSSLYNIEHSTCECAKILVKNNS